MRFRNADGRVKSEFGEIKDVVGNPKVGAENESTARRGDAGVIRVERAIGEPWRVVEDAGGEVSCGIQLGGRRLARIS